MRKYSLWLMALLVLATGCKKEKVAVRFLVTAESPKQESAEKTHLVDEKYVCWDNGDQFTINSNLEGQAPTVATYESGQYNAYFESYLDFDANKFCALFPHSSNNVIQMNDAGTVLELKCDFPASQPFRDDYTFGTNACPMVAYETETSEPPFHMEFHNLCGITRIELYGTGTVKEVRKVEFVEANGKQISGMFTVNDHDTYNPYLTATNPGTDASKKITIDCSRRIGSGETMMTFYLVLPALGGTTSYKLHMTVTNNEGNQYKKTLTVPIRRNGITKTPAIAISEWGVPAAGGTGSGSITITGNGTKSRPFQIYTAAELAYLRDKNNAGATVNTYTLTKDTYIQIMRSDIVLTTSNWTSGFSGFQGHFIYNSSASSNPGITNNSNQPIFTSISNNGVVEGLTVKGSSTQNTAEAKEFSPLCNSNSGKIIDCKVASNASFTLTSTNPSTGTGIAGICVHNNDGALIEGCGCSGQLDSRDHVVAGICLYNHNGGTIRGCHITSPMLATRCLEAAGICYNNIAGGIIENCYFAANTNSSTSHWGGIVYKNSGNISRCFVDRSGVISTTRSVGGIVNTNNNGIVDRCWNTTDRMQSTSTVNDGVGGLIYRMTGGELRNSYCNIPSAQFSATTGWVGGAIAEMSGGSACNSYSFSRQSQVSGHKGTFVGNLTGGSVENCYGRSQFVETRFYGAKAGTPTVTHCCDYAATGVAPDGITYPADITALLIYLNGWTPAEPSNYFQWVNSTGANATSIHNTSSTYPSGAKRPARR